MSVSTEQLLTQYPRKPLHEFESTHKIVAFMEVEDKEREIERKYKPAPFFGQLPLSTQIKIIVNTDIWDVAKILETVAITAGIGGGAGAVAGMGISWISGNKLQVTPLTTAGGALLGAKIGYKIALSNFVKNHSIEISKLSEFGEWKKGLDKERYDLFLNCLKNHIDMDETFENFFCPVTLDVPEIPVRCPNGRVYEKKAIEDHLDQRWTAIQRLRDSKCSPDRINAALETVSPLRGRPFKKEDLKYAVEFSREAVRLLERVRNDIKSAHSSEAIVIEGLKRLIRQYRVTHQAVTDETISLMTRDIFKLGGNDDQRRRIIEAYRNNVRV